MTEPVPPLRQLVPEVSSELSAVVARALERDRNKRFASCAEFTDALEAAAVTRDGIASSRELAAYVNQVMGQEIEQQRDAVRAWLARSEPSDAASSSLPPPGPVSSSVSSAAMSLPGDERSRSLTQPTLTAPLAAKRSRAPLVLGVLLLMGLVGVGGFVIARSTQSTPLPLASPVAEPNAAVEASAAAAAPSSAAPPLSATAAASASATASVSASATASASVPATPVVQRPRPPKSKSKSKSESSKKSGNDLDIANPYR
jgi:serine/threonine-protein kinase